MSTLIWTDIDYDKNGKQVSWLNLPHSVTRSAYGIVRIPICVMKNRPGPDDPLHGRQKDRSALPGSFGMSIMPRCRAALSAYQQLTYPPPSPARASSPFTRATPTGRFPAIPRMVRQRPSPTTSTV